MSLTQWTGADINAWEPVGATTPALPPAFYQLMYSSNMLGDKMYLAKFAPKYDRVVVIKDGVSEHLCQQIRTFRAERPKYHKFNLLHKRGILLHGPAGSGKTMACMLAGEDTVASGGIVVVPSSPHNWQPMGQMFLQIRQVHPDLPILAICEDIDHESYSDYVERFLSMLDGKDQVDNIFWLATTNHLDEIDPRLTNRPKRFDEVIYVGPPTTDARRSYLEQIVPADQAMRKESIDAMTSQSDGLMLAHLSDLMISYLVLGHDLTKSVERLKAMNATSLPTDDEIMGTTSDGVLTLQIPAGALKRKHKR